MISVRIKGYHYDETRIMPGVPRVGDHVLLDNGCVLRQVYRVVWDVDAVTVIAYVDEVR